MSKSVRLFYIGTRHKDFSVVGPVTGTLIPVEVRNPRALRIDAADAAALIERDPHMWGRDSATPAAEAEPEVEQGGEE